MSDQYTELVLEELGLLPLWLPPERMPTPASSPRTAPPEIDPPRRSNAQQQRRDQNRPIRFDQFHHVLSCLLLRRAPMRQTAHTNTNPAV